MIQLSVDTNGVITDNLRAFNLRNKLQTIKINQHFCVNPKETSFPTIWATGIRIPAVAGLSSPITASRPAEAHSTSYRTGTGSYFPGEGN
jgi:hypothetical protein